MFEKLDPTSKLQREHQIKGFFTDEDAFNTIDNDKITFKVCIDDKVIEDLEEADNTTTNLLYHNKLYFDKINFVMIIYFILPK